MTKIRYGIADDHAIFRQGVVTILSPYEEFKLVLEAENGEDLIKNLQKCRPDVILLDLKMPVMDGIESIKEIRKTDSEVKIIILSMFDEEKYIWHLMELGANGYLLKNAKPTEIRIAINTAYTTGYYFNDMVNKALLKKLVIKSHIKPDFSSSVNLTEREIQVLKLICEEHTAQEISKMIFLSPRTIEGIRTKLLEKIGVKNTAGLVMYAVKNKIVE